MVTIEIVVINEELLLMLSSFWFRASIVCFTVVAFIATIEVNPSFIVNLSSFVGILIDRVSSFF